MRALVLALAALAALPALGGAQTRAISTNPRSTDPRASEPADGWPRRYAPRDERDRWSDDYGAGRRRSRPVVIVISPYDGYGPGSYAGSYSAGGYGVGGYGVGAFGSTSTTTYTGSYTPSAARPERAAGNDTTYVRYEPAPAANAPAVSAAAPASISLAVERVAGSMLRLRWTGRAAGVREVTLVVADANRRVLAAQTVRAAPFSAVFDHAPRVAFVGTTVVRADGGSTTTLVPVGRVAGARKPLPAIRRTPD